MRRLITLVIVVGLMLAGTATASASDELLVYQGSEWTELVRRAFDELPNLGPIPAPGPITGSAAVDDRIWDIAFGRGYEMRPSPSGSLVRHEGLLMQSQTAGAWEELQAAARQAGHDLAIHSAYRSVSTQRFIFNRELGGTSNQEIDSVLQFHAPPGASRHHTGYALDVKLAGGTIQGFGRSAAFAWISANNYQNAKRFGFVPSYPPGVANQGPRPEAWEYVYVGRELVLGPSEIPLIGDWTGNGIETSAVFDRGAWRLIRSDGDSDVVFFYGNPGDRPVVGDWDGDGVDTPGVVRDGRWFLRNSNSQGVAGLDFWYGNPGDSPFAGDWDGDGTDTPGLHRRSDGKVYLRSSTTQGVAHIHFFFGNPGDIALPGDFEGEGRDSVSLYRPSEQRFYVINQLGSEGGGLGDAEYSYLYGIPEDIPLAGDYDGDGVDTPGVYRDGVFYLRNSNTAGSHDVSSTCEEC